MAGSTSLTSAVTTAPTSAPTPTLVAGERSTEEIVQNVLDHIEQVILGKTEIVKLALTCLLAGGHLLLEDLPGVGKTTLAHALANSFGFGFCRIQFTSDLLPADILGISTFDPQRQCFSFHPGPIFSQMILADEINRATPKTQSALLEAMEERNVSLEGQTHSLPEPFFVIATQNPSFQIGTFALPESQLDRFLMRLQIGYPDSVAELALLRGQNRRELLSQMQPCSSIAELARVRAEVSNVQASDDLLSYIQAILHFSRKSELFAAGLSPRAGLALLQASRAWAVVHQRGFVVPEDVQAVLVHVVGHRLRAVAGQASGQHEAGVAALLAVGIP